MKLRIDASSPGPFVPDDRDDELTMVDQMEWLGDQLDAAQSEAAANDERARYWEQQYRRLTAELVRVAREAPVVLLPVAPGADREDER